ncbi:ABC transporter ATP-binding protein [Actinosynnema sp. NPDC023587]|uniref:ATP-binding cassette domain-containing protein n=1 Tax=Actinosynnema sp. NPDC023587 TaxID=3154695 RepID=UPI0033D79DA1
MEIHAQRVGVTGPHGPLLKPTSLRVPAGELLLVAGPPAAGHTAFALVLSGRMRPSTGTVTPDDAVLRGGVVLVDSPDVTEPEASLSLSGVVGEELAVNGRRSGRKAVADWLVERGAEEHVDARFEYVPADVRCALMMELAAGRPGARVLVVDTPDRYHGDPTSWLALARDRVTPELSVVVLCTTTSAEVLGVPVARLGADNTAPVREEPTAKHALAPTERDLRPVSPPTTPPPAADNAVITTAHPVGATAAGPPAKHAAPPPPAPRQAAPRQGAHETAPRADADADADEPTGPDSRPAADHAEEDR